MNLCKAMQEGGLYDETNFVHVQVREVADNIIVFACIANSVNLLWRLLCTMLYEFGSKRFG